MLVFNVQQSEPAILLVAKSRPTLATPWTVAHRLLCPRDVPDKNTGVGCHFLLQGIFQTQGSNPSLLHYRQILYCWATKEAPWISYKYTYISFFFGGGFPSPLGRSGIGNSNPLQYSCLENSMDKGAWQAPVHGATKNRTQLCTHTHLGHHRALNRVPWAILT